MKLWDNVRELWEKIVHTHRSDDVTSAGAVWNFFLPRLTLGFFIRMWICAILAVILFGFLLLPCIINGESMMPTYPSKGLNFCWRGRYWFSEPKRGDVVVIKYSDRIYFLKRIVGLPGETVEFRGGDLYIDGKRLVEPYVRYISDWNLSPRKVSPGSYYVVGDNRSQYIDVHRFGQVRRSKILGSPIW